ncbi:hypothetical protein HYD81_03345 [Mycoplasmopsis bovis]|nr:hypothetical protein [Mycoplasmopsis bovis]QQH42630.1 hypothetical protein HYD81_03345 [Mycoplasmopsis bovis]
MIILKKLIFLKILLYILTTSQYSSKEYLQLIERLNGKVSMSRIGNSLDNREIEYFFQYLKLKCLKILRKVLRKWRLKLSVINEIQ